MKMPGKLDDEDAVGHHNAGHHKHAHQRHHIQGAPGDEQDDEHSGEPRGNGHQDDQGIDEGGELSHEDEIYEHDRENQTNTKAEERFVHADYASADRDADVLRLFDAGNDPVDLAVHVLQRFR